MIWKIMEYSKFYPSFWWICKNRYNFCLRERFAILSKGYGKVFINLIILCQLWVCKRISASKLNLPFLFQCQIRIFVVAVRPIYTHNSNFNCLEKNVARQIFSIKSPNTIPSSETRPVSFIPSSMIIHLWFALF